MQSDSTINPLGVGLAAIGALTMAIAAFLPLDEPGGEFAYVQQNTLIQHGGWLLIALAVGIVAAIYRVYRGGTRTWVPILLCVIAGC